MSIQVSTRTTHPTWLPSLLGLFIAVGPAATDMYLPAFPAVEATFGTEPGTAQLTLATWFAGLAVGQITQGTLSDRFGRRIPLMAGFCVFTLATLGCALAPSLTTLAIFRAVAAFGASAGMVIARAVVRDLSEGQAAAIMMSRLVLVMGVAPILAPTIGGAILAFAHWRVIFWLLAVYGTACVITAWKILPETLPPERRTRLSLAGQAARYFMIVREKTFLTHAIMGGCSTFCMFAYLAGCSPVFEDGFGLNPSEFALIFGLCAVSLVMCSQLNARLLPRFGLSFMLTAIARISCCGTIVLLAVAFSGPHVLWAVVAPLVVVIGCQGFNNANTNAGALSRHAGHAGSAAALMGTLQFSLGATSGVLVGLLTDGTPRGMAALMFCGMLGAVIADRFRVRPEKSPSMIVGIPACAKTLSDMPFHQTPARYAHAVLGGAGALPVLIPPLGERMLGLLDDLCGLLIPGSPSNVHPSLYDGGESETPDFHDPERDRTSLPLIRAAIAAGIPVLAICRGIQELNVALGGTLHQRVHTLSDRLDHRGGPGPNETRYGPKHGIDVTGSLARIVGADTITVNSLHGQAIDRLGDGLVAEAYAPDGTIEAVAMPSAPGWLLGVQWHPEWGYAANPHSVAIFTAFGDACRKRARSRSDNVPAEGN